MTLIGPPPKELNSSRGLAWLQQLSRMPACFFFDGERASVPDTQDEPTLYEFTVPPSVFRQVGDKLSLEVVGQYVLGTDGGTRNFRVYFNNVLVAALSFIPIGAFGGLARDFFLEVNLWKLPEAKMYANLIHTCTRTHAPSGTADGEVSFNGLDSTDMIDESGNAPFTLKITIDTSPISTPLSEISKILCKACFFPAPING